MSLYFEKVFVDQAYRQHPRVDRILAKIRYDRLFFVEDIERLFQQNRRPFALSQQKRFLYLGPKKGTKVKRVPEVGGGVYGNQVGEHYYFISAYNCILKCDYCYLKGYFASADIVLFLNYEEILEDIERCCKAAPDKVHWFHAGEFSDSLALSDLTSEWEVLLNGFRQIPNAKLELRTKSTKIGPLLALEPNDRVVVSYSVSAKNQSREFESGCPMSAQRFRALEKLAARGWRIGMHWDPIIWMPGWEAGIEAGLASLSDLAKQQIDYISVGVLRFPKDGVRVQDMPAEMMDGLHLSFDGKYRYLPHIRHKIFKRVGELHRQVGIDLKKVYLCMEDFGDSIDSNQGESDAIEKNLGSENLRQGGNHGCQINAGI